MAFKFIFSLAKLSDFFFLHETQFEIFNTLIRIIFHLCFGENISFSFIFLNLSRFILLVASLEIKKYKILMGKVNKMLNIF